MIKHICVMSGLSLKYICHANNPGLTLTEAADEQDICNIWIISAASRDKPNITDILRW